MYICENFATIKARYEQNLLQTHLESLSLSPSHPHSSHITKKLFIYLLSSVYWFLFFVKVVSCVWLFATPWTGAYQAPLSMEFSRQFYWSR